MSRPTGRHRRATRAAVVVFVAALAQTACGDDPVGPAPWLLDPAQPIPRWLSETSIYTDPVALAPAGHLVPYTPPHPLYSNRARKQRLLWLPPGTRIDTSDPDRWVFPEGAVLVKTFSYRHVEGRLGEVAIETRVIRRAADGWQYGVYHWGADGHDARLADERWPESRFALEDVNGSAFDYVIPSALDCEACHESHARAPVIGLDPDNLDPALIERAPQVFSSPPEPAPLPASSDAEARAMSYIVGNCTHCHHGQRGGDNTSFDLRPPALVARTVGVPTDSSASGDGIRVVPGAPERSALYEAVVDAREPDYRGDFKPMPPVGVLHTDHDAAGILRRWIVGLEVP